MLIESANHPKRFRRVEDECRTMSVECGMKNFPVKDE